VGSLDTFHINHIQREENESANTLAQQTSGYEITKGMFIIKRKLISLGAFICDSESDRLCFAVNHEEVWARCHRTFKKVSRPQEEV
jgi:hypothetical protein